MIEQKVDPMNPRGSCQRLLNEFATLLGGARGRVWVGSREMKQIFEVGREEVRVRLKGSTLGKEVGKIEVEISKVRRVFLPSLLFRRSTIAYYISFPPPPTAASYGRISRTIALSYLLYPPFSLGDGSSCRFNQKARVELSERGVCMGKTCLAA